MNISIIGFGNMAKAMAKKLVQDKSIRLRVSSPSLPAGVNADGIEMHSNNLAVLPEAEIIILAVKPAQMRSVLNEIGPALSSECVLVSVASGLNLAWFALDRPIVRAMPNIAAATGQSATPLVANQWVTASQKDKVGKLFGYLGLATWITEENQMNALTALSGSGPAYVFLFMESMIDAAIALGLSKDVATTFTLQTFQGASGLAVTTRSTPKELREAVTSPAGTTAAAIQVFREHGFEKIIQDAMLAAFKRAIDLGQQFTTAP